MQHTRKNKTSGPTLSKQVVVITGASSGAGRAIAVEFARYRATLVLAARRKESLDEVVNECKSLVARAIAVPTDVTIAEAMQQLAKAAFDFGGRLDVWVNNAGVLAAGAFDETPVEVHDQVIKTNLMGYLHGAYAALPYFKQQEFGILINNISVGGWFPTPYAVGYTASKFGLRGFAEALRGELSKWPNIHVCNLYPAFLDTPGIQHAANYTGKVIKPAPPVYNPRRLARVVTSVAQNPRQTATIGSVATLLRLFHFLLPSAAARIAARMIDLYLNSAKPISATSGNLFAPVEYGNSIYGSWSLKKEPLSIVTPARAALIAAFVTGMLVTRNLKK